MSCARATEVPCPAQGSAGFVVTLSIVRQLEKNMRDRTILLGKKATKETEEEGVVRMPFLAFCAKKQRTREMQGALDLLSWHF